jgi:predicted dehydrogenase
MNQPISIAVIGCGYWGPNLARNFRSLPNCTLAAVCDTSHVRLAQMRALLPEAEPLLDAGSIFSRNDIRAVAIATPLRTHFDLAMAALSSGKHVLVEKPLADSSHRTLRLIREAERNGAVLMAGHTFLYSAAVRKIEEIIRSGAIGEIRCIHARRLNLGIFQSDINAAWDLAPHDLSIILHLLRDHPERVNCQGNAHVTPGVEDFTTMSLTFPENRFATIQSSWLEPRKVREMTIVGSRRMIVYDDLQPLEKIRIYDTRVERPPHYDSFGDFHYAYHYGDSFIPHIAQAEPLKTECQHFLDCIRTGQTPLSGGIDALRMVRILEAASDSLRNGGAPVTCGGVGDIDASRQISEANAELEAAEPSAA